MFDAKMDAPMSVAVLVATAITGVRFMVDYYLFLLVLISDGSGIYLKIINGLRIYTQSCCDMLVRV